MVLIIMVDLALVVTWVVAFVSLDLADCDLVAVNSVVLDYYTYCYWFLAGLFACCIVVWYDVKWVVIGFVLLVLSLVFGC